MLKSFSLYQGTCDLIQLSMCGCDVAPLPNSTNPLAGVSLMTCYYIALNIKHLYVPCSSVVLLKCLDFESSYNGTENS